MSAEMLLNMQMTYLLSLLSSLEYDDSHVLHEFFTWLTKILSNNELILYKMHLGCNLFMTTQLIE